jgi:hypothetical protein
MSVFSAWSVIPVSKSAPASYKQVAPAQHLTVVGDVLVLGAAAGKPGAPAARVPLFSLRARVLACDADAVRSGLSHGIQILEAGEGGSAPRLVATLGAPDGGALAALVSELEAALRAGAPAELQLERYWVHQLLTGGTVHAAALAGDAGTLVALLAAAAGGGADEGGAAMALARAPDGEGAAPLHLAAAVGSAEAVSALLEAGAEVGAADADGNTALHLAALGGHAVAAQVLLVNGAPLAASNVVGQSPLGAVLAHPDLLLGGGAAEALRGLALAMLTYGAPPGEADGDGLTPAHRVALLPEGGGIVKALAKRGGALGAPALLRSGDGADDALAPLHLACGARWDGDPRGGEGAIELPSCEEGGNGGAGGGHTGGAGEDAGGERPPSRGAIGDVPLARAPCLSTLTALLVWGAPPNAATGATREAPLHLVLRQLLALRRAGRGGDDDGAATALRAAAAALAAHGARLEARDVRGVSVDALAEAAGMKKQLQHGLEGWAARAPPRLSDATVALAGGAPAAGEPPPGAPRERSRSTGFGALLGALGVGGGGGGGGGAAAAAAAAAAAPCKMCAQPVGGAPLRRCALCAVGGCAACVSRPLSGGDSDDDEDNGSPAPTPSAAAAGGGGALRSVKGFLSAASAALKAGDLNGGGGGSAPPSPAAAAPPRLCAGCFNRALAAEMAAAAEAAAWAAEKAAAVAGARNFDDGRDRAPRGGRLSALAERTSKLLPAGAASSEAQQRAALFAGAPARAAAAAAPPPPQGAAAKLGGVMGSLGALLAGNKEALVQRGEKLSRAEERAADLADSAAEFGSLAAQLKKKAQGGWW